MARRVYLHIGTMKSGTTYVQAMMNDNADALAAAGILWQGSGSNFSAVKDLARRGDKSTGAWPTFAQRVVEHPGDAVISNEFLSLMDGRKSRRVVDALAPAQIEVIVTARDLGRGVASQWQERARHRPMSTWAEFMDQLMADDSRTDGELAWFWRRQDLIRILDVWVGHVGSDHVTVVTVPPPGTPSEVVAQRFASAIRADGLRQLTVTTARNPTLGAYSSELMRRVQERLSDDMRPRVRTVLKHVLARRVLARRSAQEPAIGLSAEQFAWVQDQALASIHAMSAAGVQVIGDPDDLLPRQPDDVIAASDPGDTPDDLLLEAALDAVIGLVECIEQQARAGGDSQFAGAVRQLAAADGSPSAEDAPLNPAGQKAQTNASTR